MAKMYVGVTRLDEFVRALPKILINGRLYEGGNVLNRFLCENFMGQLTEQSSMWAHIRRKLVGTFKDGFCACSVSQVANIIKELTFTDRSIPCKLEPIGELH
jgi:hypothetical protein